MEGRVVPALSTYIVGYFPVVWPFAFIQMLLMSVCRYPLKCAYRGFELVIKEYLLK